MDKLEVGQVHSNGLTTREITNIDNKEVYYIDNIGQESHCKLRTFKLWLSKREVK